MAQIKNYEREELYEKVILYLTRSGIFKGGEPHITLRCENGEDDSYFKLINADGFIDLNQIEKLKNEGFEIYNVIANNSEIILNVTGLSLQLLAYLKDLQVPEVDLLDA